MPVRAYFRKGKLPAGKRAAEAAAKQEMSASNAVALIGKQARLAAIHVPSEFLKLGNRGCGWGEEGGQALGAEPDGGAGVTELPPHPQFEPKSAVRSIQNPHSFHPFEGGLFPIKTMQNCGTFGAASTVGWGVVRGL